MTDTSLQGQWKSRFPVARIKKIMQADEDVGKVAQVTPVAISKALELFMDRIIQAVASETKSRGARRVTPKQIISTQKEFDFLESLTAEIPLPPSRQATPVQGTRRRRKQSPSTDATPAVDRPKRKRRAAKVESPATDTVKDEDKEDHALNVQEQPENQDDGSDQSEHAEKKRGWFDVVMGSNEESSSDESSKKRRIKDEDDDYVD